jgi:hypothetical protein
MIRSIRRGERPAVSDAGPQRQLTDRATPELWGALVGSAVALPGVEEGHSQVSPASSRALFLRDQRDHVVPWTSLAPDGRLEPVHLHGVEDTSVHLCLPVARGVELTELGWAIPHQYEPAQRRGTRGRAVDHRGEPRVRSRPWRRTPGAPPRLITSRPATPHGRLRA